MQTLLLVVVAASAVAAVLPGTALAGAPNSDCMVDHTGGLVWQRPTSAPKGRWMPVLAVTLPGGAVATRSGWLRQIGPYESR